MEAMSFPDASQAVFPPQIQKGIFVIQNNDFTFDLNLNATLIQQAVNNALVYLENESFFFEKARRHETRDGIIANLKEANERCKNVCSVSKQMEISAVSTMIPLVENYLSLLIQSVEEKGRSLICILAPMFNENNITDGYIRRIKNIDELIPSSTFRVYVYSDPSASWPSIELIDDSHAILTYNDTNDIKRSFALIIDHASLIYCHSIHRFDTQLLKHCNKDIILDFHGAVPEETLYLSGDTAKTNVFSDIERTAVAKCSTIIAVTNNMVKHIQEKYPQESLHTEFIVMPILDTDIRLASPKHLPLPETEKQPCIIYAGGTQKWQLIDEMIDAVSSQPNRGSYKFFTPDPDKFERLWKGHTKPFDMRIERKTPEELRDEYLHCDFGFILRDESIVNRVACPTKLIEYLANGVIPIVKNSNIGDFREYGYAYVSLSDFVAGKLPPQKERAQMIAKNHLVIESQLASFFRGKESLKEILCCQG